MASPKLSVSEITALIQSQLEDCFPSVVVEGELSNYRPSSTGHLYFSLKDSKAVLNVVMFKGQSSRIGFTPKDGMLLRAKGRISVYPPRGSYQLIAEELELAGAGDILAMLEMRKRALAAEGLFGADRKKPVPRFPQTVGVVSSPTGAAVQDILNVLRRRAAGIRVIILPAPVQGNDAAPIIARRIEQANRWKLADVLIVGRGGGSLEDLLPFSEEIVVRAVAASEIPVVSAVGHEIDNALSDLAADLRAPTPSAAAELVSSQRSEAARNIAELREEMASLVMHRLERIRLLVRMFNREELIARFHSILQPCLLRFDDGREVLLQAMQAILSRQRNRFELAKTTLEAASPLSILQRGFAVVRDSQSGTVIRKASQTKKGSMLSIQLLEGSVLARTEELKNG